MRKVDVGTLQLSSKHIKKALQALKSNRLSYGPMTEEFERRFANKHKNKYGIFVNSGTSALQAAIHALKILNNWKNGDEIIMPATTFVATYNVIKQNSLKPVLVDVATDFNIDVELIEDKITPKTRAIMVVHLLGKPANMKEILKIAKKHNLKVIEDSCETMGVKGVARGDVTCFSFYIAHILTTGVGGMATTNNKKLADLIRSLIFHGRDNKYLQIDDDNKYDEDIIHSRFRFNHPGYSYRGTEVESALGLVEMDLLDKYIEKRQKNARYLNEKLNMHSEDYFNNNACMLFPIVTDRRNELMEFLEKRGITTRTIMPLINQPYIKVKQTDYKVSYILTKCGLLIGCHQDLTKQDLDYIVKSIKEFYEQTSSKV